MPQLCLAFNQVLTDIGSPLHQELGLINKLWDALGAVFPEVPDDPARWHLSAKRNCCTIKVLLIPETELTLQLSVFPRQHLPSWKRNPYNGSAGPIQPGRTTATLFQQDWGSRQNKTIDQTDLNNDDWVDFVGWFSLARDHFRQSIEPIWYRTTKDFEFTLAKTVRTEIPLFSVGERKPVDYVSGVPFNQVWHVPPNTLVAVVCGPDGSTVRPFAGLLVPGLRVVVTIEDDLLVQGCDLLTDLLRGCIHVLRAVKFVRHFA